jgi:ABC-type uncharacterized transport system permease subunit
MQAMRLLQYGVAHAQASFALGMALYGVLSCAESAWGWKRYMQLVAAFLAGGILALSAAALLVEHTQPYDALMAS